MSKYISKPISVAVFQEGESPIYSDTAFHVSVEDLAEGPFIRIVEVPTGEKIEVELIQLAMIFEEAKKLMREHRGE